ncbi:unnamed protein product [Polarella glacialis]|uniref:EF-hand domain-containing protein n=1 Tax=Polarella glacialis TaxID=89957 RepID=A0A813EP36_POLGL|nr:unnamed protein product [Polarella glacialis]
MLEWLSSHLLERKVEGQRGQPPRLHDSPERWFQHFDFTNAGRLSKAEFLRGVAKAYDVSLLAAPSTPSRRKRGEGVHKLRELVDAVWDEVRWAEAVPLEDFTGRHGLAERLLAALPSDDLPHVGERLLSVDEEDGGRQPPLRLPFRKSVVQEAPALLSVDEALAKARVSDFETRKADEARALERAERVRAATQLEAPDQRVDGSSPPGRLGGQLLLASLLEAAREERQGVATSEIRIQCPFCRAVNAARASARHRVICGQCRSVFAVPALR